MATNFDRFKNDLEKLIEKGDTLLRSMIKDSSKSDEFRRGLLPLMGEDKVDEYIKNLPKFKTHYESWYSESLALIRQLLPSRLENFKALYEKPKTRKSLDNENYVIQDFMLGLSAHIGDVVRVDPSAAIPRYKQQLAILQAANARFESSLFEIRQLVQGDLFESELDAARELLAKRFLRASGAIAGVVLEKHLRQVLDDHSITITKKNPTISELNDLLKSNGIIEIAQWRHISMLGDIRNLCDHNKQKEPTLEQLNDLIDGTAKVLKTII